MADKTTTERLRELRSHLVKALDALGALGRYNDTWKGALVTIKKDVEKALGE